MKIGIYHGDEDWVLKGIGQDLANSLAKIPGLSIQTTDRVFKGERLRTDYHVFVQQGQLNANVKRNNNTMPKNTICLFTHLDVGNFAPKILKNCKAVVFNSSIQLSMAIANGYNPSNALLVPHAVDPNLHKILPPDNAGFKQVQESIFRKHGKWIEQHSTVGFCGRYWDRNTYTRRKNYIKVKETAYSLAESGISVIILGPNWEQLFQDQHENLILLSAKYKDYPYIYNLMRVFVSLSIHEGGPLPLLESMCCGCFPIVTNTGFAFDVTNTFQSCEMISPFQSTDSIVQLVTSKFNTHKWDIKDIRNHGSKFSFDNLAKTIFLITQN